MLGYLYGERFGWFGSAKHSSARHSSYLPAYEDGTECSETSAYKIQTPEESLQHLEQG